MNEELKIIIKAAIGDAQKNIQKVSSALKSVGATAGKAAKSIGSAMATIGKTVAKGVAVATAALAGLTTALVALGKNTLEFRKQQAQLVTAFEAAGSSAEQAGKTYAEFFSFLGETDTAVEASNLLAQITTDEQKLAEWTNTLMGVYATFPDSLPIEALTESANETIKVGKVTGNLADALNWAGASEEAFNAQLAATNSEAEREALVRETLNGLYGEAAALYAENNKKIIAYQQSQAKLDTAMARAGDAVQPLMTALNNLGAVFFNALVPALNVIVPMLERFINAISRAITWVSQLFGIMGSGATATKSVATGLEKAGKATNSIKSGLGGLGAGAKVATKGINATAEATEELQRKTEGFDELNIVGSSSGAGSGSGASGASGSGGASGTGASGGGMSLQDAMAQAGAVTSGLKEQAGSVFDNILETIESKMPILIEKGFNFLTSFITGILKAVPRLVQTIVALLPSIINGIVALVNAITQQLPAIIQALVDGIVAVLPVLIEGIISTTSEILKALPQIITSIVAALPTLIPMLIDGIVSCIVMLCESFSSIIQPIIDYLPDIIISIIDGLMSNLPALIGGIITLVLGIVDAIPQIIKGLIDAIPTIVSSIIEGLLGALPQLIMGLIEVALGIAKALPTILVSIYAAIINVFTGIWNGITKVFENIKNWFKDKFGEGVDGIKNAFGAVGKWFITKRDEILGAFNGVAKWFGNIFKNAFSAVKNAFSGVVNFFSGIWDKIKAIFSKVGKAIGDAIKGAVSKAVNAVLSTAVKIINGFISAINAAISLINAIPGVNIKKLSKLEVPKLAKGGIIDTATLAVVGERGKEAVVPLENNTEWMDKLADRLAQRSNTPTKIVLMLDKKELGSATIDAINANTKLNGALQLQLI